MLGMAVESAISLSGWIVVLIVKLFYLKKGIRKLFLKNFETGEDKEWTRGPWTTFKDQVHGLPVMDRVYGHFF